MQKQIMGSSTYFERKYGTPNPVIDIEGTFEDVYGGGTPFDRRWDGNIGAMLFRARVERERIPTGGTFYYGHVQGMGEIVHESELQDVPEGTTEG